MNNKNLIIILIDKISLIKFSIHPFMIKNLKRSGVEEILLNTMKNTDNKPINVLWNENYTKAAPIYSGMRCGVHSLWSYLTHCSKPLDNKTREETAERPVGKMSKFTHLKVIAT